MRGSRFAMAAIAVAIGLVAPSAAHADDLGEPDLEQAYNDGEQGVIALSYGLGIGGDRRRLNADCNFVLLPAVNSSTVQVLLQAQSTATADNPSIAAAATGVECTLIAGDQTRTITSAKPGAAGVEAQIVEIRLAPITLCALPSVLWTDNVYQEASEARCKSS